MLIKCARKVKIVIKIEKCTYSSQSKTANFLEWGMGVKGIVKQSSVKNKISQIQKWFSPTYHHLTSMGQKVRTHVVNCRLKLICYLLALAAYIQKVSNFQTCV